MKTRGREWREEVKRKISREQALRKLWDLAAGRANDAVELAFREEGEVSAVQELDLTAVAEFRRSNLGSVEIKFIDRVKALTALIDLLEDEGEGRSLLREMLSAGEDGQE